MGIFRRLLNAEDGTKDKPEHGIRTDPQNAAAVFRNPQQLGAPLEGLKVPDFSEDGFFYQMGVPPVRADILPGIPGLQFQDAWGRRETVWFDDLPVTFISRKELMEVKRASGRPQAPIDIELLSHSPDV